LLFNKPKGLNFSFNISFFGQRGVEFIFDSCLVEKKLDKEKKDNEADNCVVCVGLCQRADVDQSEDSDGPEDVPECSQGDDYGFG